MALQLSDLTQGRLAENVYRNRDYCVSELANAETPKDRKDWALQLAKTDMLISAYRLDRYAHRT